jgi:hypothetical protein
MDNSEAARLYKLAADQGNALAQVNLAVFFENGSGGLPKDDREADRLTSSPQIRETLWRKSVSVCSTRPGVAAYRRTTARPPAFISLPQTREMQLRRPIWGSSTNRVAAGCLRTIARPPDFSNSPRTRERSTRELVSSA